jgi:outer membrane protein assembly factor BamB
MTRRLLLALAALAVSGSDLRAQISFDRSQIPTRTTLERVGLERHWMGVVPLTASERVLSLNLDGELLFAQTSSGQFHVFNGETGQYLWSKDLAVPTASALQASVAGRFVVVASVNHLYCLERDTGRQIWHVILESSAASPTSADEDFAYVGLNDGKVLAYTIQDYNADQKRPGLSLSAGKQAWAWKTKGKVTGRVIPTEHLVAFASQDGRAVVAIKKSEDYRPIEQLFRFRTGGPISASMTPLGTRTLLIPSEDGNLYATDLFNGKTRWIFPSGSPIDRSPLVAQGDVYVRNSLGQVSNLDPETGQVRWTENLGEGHFLAAGATRLYILNGDGELAIGDRATGAILMDGRATSGAGLHLGDYRVTLANRVNDRLYLCTTSGLVLCLREAGKLQPTSLIDPKAEPFGTKPEGGEDLTPPPSPPATDKPDADDPASPKTEKPEEPATSDDPFGSR